VKGLLIAAAELMQTAELAWATPLDVISDTSNLTTRSALENF
jgi:hypothetical protein